MEANLVDESLRIVWTELFERYLSASLKPAEATGSSACLKNSLLTLLDEQQANANCDLFTVCSDYLKKPAPLTYFLENPPISDAAKDSLMEWYVKLGRYRHDLDLYCIREHSQHKKGLIDHFMHCYISGRVEMTYLEKVQWISTREDYCPIWWITWIPKNGLDNVAIDACHARNYFESQFMDWAILKNFENFKPMEFLVQADNIPLQQQRTIVPLHYWFRGTNIFVNYNGWMVGNSNQELMTSGGYRLSSNLVLVNASFKNFTPLMFLQCAFMVKEHTSETGGRYKLHKFIVADHHDHVFDVDHVNSAFQSLGPRIMEDGVVIHQYVIPDHILDDLADDMYLLSI